MSRTMMLEELSLVLDLDSLDVTRDAYRAAILDQNILGKPTRTTRLRTAKRLCELYALDPSCPLFRLLRHYWSVNQDGRPMLAFLAAAARDPLLREMTPFVLRFPVRASVEAEEVAKQLGENYPGRFQATTQRSAAQNLASSWTQAGYLQGKIRKKRTRPRVTPVVLTYAVSLGFLCGLRGKMLLHSTWTDLLDRTPTELQDMAFQASSQGWLNYKAAGDVVEITLPEIPNTKSEGQR
jgi:hypothetical protein